MPPRPVIKVRQNRPVSAIYLGKGGIGGPSPSLQELSQSASGYANLISATPPNLPDLPEPESDAGGRSSDFDGDGEEEEGVFERERERVFERREREMLESPSPSPGSRRGGGGVKLGSGSGLPSPPATNSTGSGSTGDPATIRGEPPTRTSSRPVSLHSNSSAGTSTEGFHNHSQHHQHRQHYSASSSSSRRRSTNSSISSFTEIGGPTASGSGNNSSSGNRLQDVELPEAGVDGNDMGIEGDYDDDADHDVYDDKERHEYRHERDYEREREYERQMHAADEQLYDDNNADNESNVDEGEGDDTARMDKRLLAVGGERPERSSSENVLALQRAKNLAQRNRMALDKLSRLSPSPSAAALARGAGTAGGTQQQYNSHNLNSSISSRSPAPAAASSSHAAAHSTTSSSSSSSRLAPNSSSSRAHLAASTSSSTRPSQITRVSSSSTDSSADMQLHDLARSGSETERESTRHSYSSYSSSHSSHSHIRSSSSSHHSHSNSVHRSPALSLSQLSRPSATTTPPPPRTPHKMSSPYHRARNISAPDSPEKVRLTMTEGSSTSSLTRSPSQRRRNRMSLASVSQFALSDQEELEEGDEQDGVIGVGVGRGERERTRERTVNERDAIIQSALAAVNNASVSASGAGVGGGSTRRSPLSARRRGALPREFRSQSQMEGRISPAAAPSPSPGLGRRERDSWKTMEPITPLRQTATGGVGRSATLRESTSSASRRRPGVQDPRWSSEDLRTSATVRGDRSSYNADRERDRDRYSYTSSSRDRDRDHTYNTSHSTEEPRSAARAELGKERRQSLRGGSAESALSMWSPGGRSLVGEGLRAAGLRPKRESLDLRGAGGVKEPTSAASERMPIKQSPQEVLDEGRRRVFTEREREKQPVRASTSMAHYAYLDRDEENSGRGRVDSSRELRSHRSAYYLTSRDLERPREHSVTRGGGGHERAASALGGYHNNVVTSPTPLHGTSSAAAHVLDRMATGSPFTSSTTNASRRWSSTSGATAQPGPSSNNPNNSSLNSSTTGHANNLSTSQVQLEHTRLMLESLAMFEGQVGKLPALGPSALAGGSQVELARNAQGVVFAAERLAGMLRHGGMRALEAQVEAEIEGDEEEEDATRMNGTGKGKGKVTMKELAEVLGRVAAEYRDGSRVADELVRGITALLLGVGRVMRDLGSVAGGGGVQGEYTDGMGVGGASPSVHNRHLSLEVDELGRRVGTPERHTHGHGHVHGSASTESGGRHSVASSRRSWEPTPAAASGSGGGGGGGGRPESVLARASPATFQKLRESRESRESPVGARNKLATSARRLFTPREKREQMLDAKAEVIRGGANMASADSQDIHARPTEPSPTPASRVIGAIGVKASPRERSRTLTPLSIPKPLPTLPSESSSAAAARGNNVNASTGNNLDKSTLARRSTLRASFPLITSPSNATTAVTPHTVSNTPSRSPFPLPRTNSDRSTGQEGVTFSKPASGSISAALEGLHLQVERQRSGGSGVGSDATPVVRQGQVFSRSTSEVERDSGAAGGSVRRSVSGNATANANVHAADRSAASTILQSQTVTGTGTRERRRTVTDIWPQQQQQK
ncbi:hypothetical protein D9613_006226 [Agrocybe pediades]|uniref:Uncharacterized protein n=1 Tax=Agrocybe pediades TaxID=84607 RepID=A0A8H4QUC5_9AGAR|nr:hypothetical protein D9613_006226 [Agrocybe pediades]